jgi:predicted nucleic acid-binding protein
VIVVDASCLVDLLLQRPGDEALARRLLGMGDAMCAPSLVDVEVCNALRRLVLVGEVSPSRGGEAVEDLAVLRLRRYPHELLLGRIWELRANLTAYDAAYVALAESLKATLLTRDRKLASTKRHRARIELA